MLVGKWMQQPMKQKDEEFGEWSHQHYEINKGSKLAIGLMASGRHIQFMHGVDEATNKMVA